MPPAGSIQYDPRDTQPLGPGEGKPSAQQPLETPASITAPPPAQITDQKTPRQMNPGPARGAGAVAFMADNILKGFAQGRQQSEMKKIANMKRTVDGQQFTYQLTAQNLKGLVQQKLEQGADPKTVMQDPEVVKAVGMRDASWAAWMKSVGQMQDEQGGGAKKPKKGKKPGGWDEKMPNPVQGAMSQDPQEKAQAWYQIAVKAGPPDRFGLNDILSQRANNDRQTLTKESASALSDADLKSNYDKLFDKQLQPAPKVTSTITTSGGDEPPPPPTSAKPPGRAPVASMQPPASLPPQASATATDGPKASSVGAIPPATPGATPTPEATPAQTIPNASGSGGTDGAPPSNLSQLEQRQLKDMREEMERRGMLKPGADGAAKGAPRMGRPVVAQDVPEGAIGIDGQPFNIDKSNPHVGAIPVYYAGGVVRWQVYSVEQQGKTSAGPSGQPIISNYDKLHGTLDTEHPVGAGVQKGEVKVVKTRDAKGNEVEALTPVAPIYATPHVPGVGTTPGHNAAPGAAAHGTERRAADRRVAKPTATESDIPPGLPAGTKVFPAYTKANQDTYKAIRTQDLTLNGVPGSSDIGLNASTLKALDNPDQRSKITIALRALDASAKQALSGRDESDFGYIQEFEKSFNNIPAVQGVMKDLNRDSKQYLADFFRAWTNAATLRALQGSSGKPQQSMYAMLTNELPTIGVNVNSKEDAGIYLSRLANDVETAKSNLPDDMQTELTREKGHTSSHGTSGSFGGTPTPPHEVDSILDGIFGPPKR